MNKSKGYLHLQGHLLVGLLAGSAPFVPTVLAVPIIFVVIAIISNLFVRKRRARKKWPGIEEIEKGTRLFEVKKRQVLSIEIKQPRRFRRGYVRITPLSSEVFTLKIARGKAFRVANSLMMRFEPERVRVQ